jgi:hypothetical protein
MYAAECFSAWVVIVGKLKPVFCQKNARVIKRETGRLLESICSAFG